MIVQDASKELKTRVRFKYESLIEHTLQEAERVQQQLHETRCNAANAKAMQLLTQTKQENDTRRTQAHAAAEMQAQSYLADLQNQAVERLFHAILEIIQQWPTEKKQALVTKMYNDVVTSIKTSGYNLKDFSILIWKGAKIKDAKSALTDLAIEAQSEQITFTRSLWQVLDEERDRITKIALDLLEQGGR